MGHLTEHLRRLPLELKAPLVCSKINCYNCNELLRGFNIFKVACGDDRAVVRTFRGIVSNAQGEIFLQFVPVEDYACINAIQVVTEQHEPGAQIWQSPDRKSSFREAGLWLRLYSSQQSSATSAQPCALKIDHFNRM